MKVMFVGDSPAMTTGLSYVSCSLMRRFVRFLGGQNVAYATITGIDTTLEGTRAHGDEFFDEFKDVTFFNCQLNDRERYSKFNDAVEAFRPTIVITVVDPWRVDQVAFSHFRATYFWVAYVTIETPRYPETMIHTSHIFREPRKSIANILKSADLVVPFTEMGRKALERMGVPASDHVYAGVELDLAQQTPARKSELFMGMVEDDQFLFMSMGVNSERKRIDRVIEAFAAFLNKRKDPQKFKLYLHTDTNSPTSGTDLLEIIDHLGLTSSVIHSRHKYGKGIPRAELYRLYSTCDCYIGLPSGEGFGYGFAEAMAHGKPLVYTDYGGHAEFARVAGEPVRVSEFYNAKNAYIKWALADVQDAVRAMNKAVSDAKFRERAKKAGIDFAYREFDWDRNSKKLFDIISEQFSRIRGFRNYGLMLKRVM